MDLGMRVRDRSGNPFLFFTKKIGTDSPAPCASICFDIELKYLRMRDTPRMLKPKDQRPNSKKQTKTNPKLRRYTKTKKTNSYN